MVIYACLLGVVWLPSVLASVCLTADGVFPNIDAAGCQNYYSCHDFVSHLHDCPDGFQFHFENLQCQPDVEVWCQWQKQNIRNYGAGSYGSSEEYWDRNYYYDDGMYPLPPIIPYGLPPGHLGPAPGLFDPLGPPPAMFDPFSLPVGSFDPLGTSSVTFGQLGSLPGIFNPRGLTIPPPAVPFGPGSSYPPLPPIEIPITIFPKEFIPVFYPSLTFPLSNYPFSVSHLSQSNNGFGSRSGFGNFGRNLPSVPFYIPDYPVLPLYPFTDQDVSPIYPPTGPYISTDLPYPLFPSIDSIPRSGYIPDFSLDANSLSYFGNLGGVVSDFTGTGYDGGFSSISNMDNIPKYGYIPGGFSDGLSINTFPLGYQGNLGGAFPDFIGAGYDAGGTSNTFPIFPNINNIPRYGYIPGFSDGLLPDATFPVFGGSGFGGTGSVFPISFNTPQISENSFGLGISDFNGIGLQGFPFPLSFSNGVGIGMNTGGINTRLNTGTNIFGATPSITGGFGGLFGGQSSYGTSLSGVSGFGGQGTGLFAGFPGIGSSGITNSGYPNSGFGFSPTSRIGYPGTIGVNNQGTGFGYPPTGLGTGGYIPTGFGTGYNVPTSLGTTNTGGSNFPFPIGGFGGTQFTGSGNYIPSGVNQGGSFPTPIGTNFGGRYGSPGSYVPNSGFSGTQVTASGGYMPTPVGFGGRGGTIPTGFNNAVTGVSGTGGYVPTGLNSGGYIPTPIGSGGMFETVPTGMNTGGSGGYFPNFIGTGGYVPNNLNYGGYSPTPVNSGRIQNTGGYLPNPIGTGGMGGYVPTNLNYGGYNPYPVGAGGLQNAGGGGFVNTGLNSGTTGGYVPTPIGTGSTGSYVPTRSGNVGGYVPSGLGTANTGNNIPNGYGYSNTGGYIPTGLGSVGTGGYVPTGLGTGGSTNNGGIFPVGTNANAGGSVVLGGFPGNSYYGNSYSPSNLGFPGNSGIGYGIGNNYPSSSGNTNSSPNNLGFPGISAYYPSNSGVVSNSGGFEGFDLGAGTVSKLSSVNASSANTADATKARTFRSTATDTLSLSINTVEAIPTTLDVNSTIPAAINT